MKQYFKGYAKLQPVAVTHAENRVRKHHVKDLTRAHKHDVWKIKVVNRDNAVKIFQMFEHYQEYLKAA